MHQLLIPEISEAYWRDATERRLQSGLTVAKFCEIEVVSTASYYNWRKRLSEQHAAGPMFVPVSVATSQPACLEIVLISGEVIRVPDGTDVGTISAVLQALGGEAC